MPSREEEIEERLEWEERKDDTPMFYHMIAGSCAGVSEHLCMFPVDTYKTHRQAANPLSPGAGSPNFLDFVRRNGFFRLWRGSGAVMVGCVPSHAAYFSAYEAGKVRLGVDKPGHHPLAAAATGVCATLLHDAVSAPTDLVKQRLQLGYYRGVLHCVRSVAASEGVASLWRSLPATLAMNVPYAATCVAVNESAKVVLRPILGADAIVTYLASGALAGAAAAAVTTPLDVIKTRMQTNGLLGGGLHPVAPLCGLCESGGSGGGVEGGGGEEEEEEEEEDEGEEEYRQLQHPPWGHNTPPPNQSVPQWWQPGNSVPLPPRPPCLRPCEWRGSSGG